MSPRTARSPARGWSSTWWTRCCPSRATARTIPSASCAAQKNRFGADRRDRRLRDDRRSACPRSAIPSALFLAEPRPAVLRARPCYASMEGTRPVLVEIQALVAPSSAGHAAPGGGRLGPQPPGHGAGRAGDALGLQARRSTTSHLNVAGGLRVGEPAADLAVAAALVSSLAGNGAAARQRSISARSALSGADARRAPCRSCETEARRPSWASTRAVAAGGGRGCRRRQRAGEIAPLAIDAIASLGELVAAIAAKRSPGSFQSARSASRPMKRTRCQSGEADSPISLDNLIESGSRSAK
jgi:DNA repair protein RadA/Sms